MRQLRLQAAGSVSFAVIVAPRVVPHLLAFSPPSPLPCPPSAQDCFKLLGGMLRQCERWAPSQGQLRFLVTWAFGDLEETAGRQNAFHLLKVGRGREGRPGL